MILLYSFVLLLLSAARQMLSWRAAALARKFARLSTQVLRLVNEPYRPGNSNREQFLVNASRQFELGRLVQNRDLVEERYLSWQGRTDTMARWLANLRAWKGQKLPYTLGAIDVWLCLSLVDTFVVGEHGSARRVFEWIVAQFGN